MKSSKIFPANNRGEGLLHSAQETVENFLSTTNRERINQLREKYASKFQPRSNPTTNISGFLKSNISTSSSAVTRKPSSRSEGFETDRTGYTGESESDAGIEESVDDDGEEDNFEEVHLANDFPDINDSDGAVDPTETIHSLRSTFKTLKNQIEEFKQKLLKATDKLQEAEKTKYELEDKALNLEQENLLLRQKIEDNIQAGAQLSQANDNGLQYLRDTLRRKRYRVTNENNNLDNRGNDEVNLLLKASQSAFDDEDLTAASYKDIFQQTNFILTFFKYYYSKLQPFKHDIRSVEGRLGSSVASYFIFQRFLFVEFSIIGMLVSSFAVYHLVKLIERGDASSIFVFNGFESKALLYSSFDTSEGAYYGWCIIGTILICLIIGVFKLVHEDKLKKALDAFESENSHPFAAEVLCSWEYQLSTNDEINDYSSTLAHAFNQLIDDSSAQGLKSRRTRQEEYILTTRRTLGFLAYFTIQTLAVGIILYLNTGSSIISTYFSSSYSSLISSISLAIINIVTPIALKAITVLEKWDYAETEVNMMVIRTYLSATLNLVVIIFTYLLLANPVLAASYPILSNLEVTSSSSYGCRLDQVSSEIFILVISNFIIESGAVLANGIYLKWYSEIFNTAYIKPEFDLSRSLVGLLDLVGKAFLLFPFSPISIILLPVFLFMKIKWEKFVMLKFYVKPRRPWKAQKASQVFTFVYLTTITVLAIPLALTFLSFKTFPKSCNIQDSYIGLCLNDPVKNNGVYTCTVDTSSTYFSYFGKGSGSNAYPNVLCASACGPFVDSLSAYALVRSSLYEVSTIGHIYDALFEYPYIPWTMALFLALYVVTEKNTLQISTQSHQNIEKALEAKIFTLEAENTKQSKIITRLQAVGNT